MLELPLWIGHKLSVWGIIILSVIGQAGFENIALPLNTVVWIGPFKKKLGPSRGSFMFNEFRLISHTNSRWLTKFLHLPNANRRPKSIRWLRFTLTEISSGKNLVKLWIWCLNLMTRVFLSLLASRLVLLAIFCLNPRLAPSWLPLTPGGPSGH